MPGQRAADSANLPRGPGTSGAWDRPARDDAGGPTKMVKWGAERQLDTSRCKGTDNGPAASHSLRAYWAT